MTCAKGTLTSTLGEVTYDDANAAQTVDAITYHDLTISNTGTAVATQEASTLLDVNGNFLISADGQKDVSVTTDLRRVNKLLEQDKIDEAVALLDEILERLER